MSYSFTGLTDPSSYRFIDSMTYNNTIRPVFCNGTANDGLNYIANWQSFNSINIGGSVHTNFEYFEIFDNVIDFWHFRPQPAPNTYKMATARTQTQARNPAHDTYYGGSPIILDIGDREMPHIVGPSMVSCRDRARDLLGGVGAKGVSAAIPSVNGIAACVIGSNTAVFRNNPENVKVALMLTAENIDGGYWNPLTDERDGCGEVSGYSAVCFARNLSSTPVPQNNTAIDSGLTWGTIPNTTTNGTTQLYNIRAPSTLPEGRHLRIVLTWSSMMNRVTPAFNRISDLNLELRRGSAIIGQCYSFEDNVEVIDIPNDQIIPGEQLQLASIFTTLRFPSGSIRTFIKYSLGWKWVNDFAGKRIQNENIDYYVDLLTRNVQFGPNVNFYNETHHQAGERIVLKPGVTISTTSSPIHTFSINSLMANYANNVTGTFSDYSGNLHNGTLFSGTVGTTVARFNHLNAINLNNSVSITLNNTVSYPITSRLTLGVWLKYRRNVDATGSIYYAKNTANNDGFTLTAGGNLGRQITFSVGNSSQVSTVSYTLVDADLNKGTWVDQNDTSRTNWGWVFVVARWQAGQNISLIINFERDVSNSTTVTSIGMYPHYIGRHPTLTQTRSFTGGMNELFLYSGLLNSVHEEGFYHMANWPEFQGNQP